MLKVLKLSNYLHVESNVKVVSMYLIFATNGGSHCSIISTLYSYIIVQHVVVVVKPSATRCVSYIVKVFPMIFTSGTTGIKVGVLVLQLILQEVTSFVQYLLLPSEEDKHEFRCHFL